MKMCCDKFSGGLLRSTFEFFKRNQKKLCNLTYPFFDQIFIINFGKVRGSRLYRRFPFLIFNNSKGFQMMYR